MTTGVVGVGVGVITTGVGVGVIIGVVGAVCTGVGVTTGVGVATGVTVPVAGLTVPVDCGFVVVSMVGIIVFEL